MDGDKWFRPKIHMGWKKNMPLEERRKLAYQAHGKNLLETARALLALSNVQQDAPTARQAGQDARFFFAMNHRMKEAQKQGRREQKKVERQIRQMRVRLTRA
jgi:hypothetical protein